MCVIVTGAAGHLGRLVTDQLLERVAPEHVVLVTRRPEALRESRARGADVRYGDFEDPASLRDAFAGGRRMLLISTDAVGWRVRQHRAAIGAAVRAGVGHVVFTSIVNPVARNPVGANAWEQGRTEVMLQRSGLAWTVLRFGSFAELQLPPVATAIRNGRLIGNVGVGRIAPVSRRDCAEAAAITLTTDGHTGQTYQITGQESLAMSELAELLTDLSGQPVKNLDLSDTLFTWVLLAIGTPLPIARGIAAYGRAVRQGYFDVVDPAFERLTGRPPVTLRDVLISQRVDLLAVGCERSRLPRCDDGTVISQRAVAPAAATAALISSACSVRAFRPHMIGIVPKSWMTPSYRRWLVGTPASASRRAYSSPSSRRGSRSAVTTSAGGNPSNEETRSGDASGALRADDSGA
jgi:NAD(P)H dehydrogenase (quinone)